MIEKQKISHGGFGRNHTFKNKQRKQNTILKRMC